MTQKPYMTSFLAIVVLVLLATSCFKIDEYPIEPEVTYQDYLLIDSFDQLGNAMRVVQIHFDILDGDGDIGNLDQDSNVIDDTTAIFIRMFEIIDGEKVRVEDSDSLKTYNIENLQPEGQDKTLRASIHVNLFYWYSSQIPLTYDTVMYDIFVRDRADHVSNIESTDTIVFPDRIQ